MMKFISPTVMVESQYVDCTRFLEVDCTQTRFSLWAYVRALRTAQLSR